MALKNIFNILVDLKIVRSINQPLVTQNDSVVFILEVMDNGVPFDLTDTTTISLAHTRKDGTVVVTPGTKIGNVATFELGTNETAVAGGVIAKAQFYGADGRVSTLSFGYQVGQDPTGADYVPSETEQTLIQVVMADAQAKIDELSAVDVVELSQQLADIANNIISYGGSGNGSTPNDTAFTNAKVDGKVFFPQNATNNAVYFFTNKPVMDGIVITAEKGVKLSLPDTGSYTMKNVLLRNSVQIVSRNGGNTEDVVTNDVSELVFNKVDFDGVKLTDGANMSFNESLKLSKVVASTKLTYANVVSNPDWASYKFNVANITVYDDDTSYVIGNAAEVPAIGNYYTTAIKALNFEALVLDKTKVRTSIVVTVNSDILNYYVFSVDLNGDYYIQHINNGVADAEVKVASKIANPYFLSKNGASIVLGVRIVNLQKAEFFVNGTMIYIHTLTTDTITNVYFGASSNVQAWLDNLNFGTLQKFYLEKDVYSKPLNIAVFGDSNSFGEGSSIGWSELLAKSIKGKRGIGSVTVTNYAVSGATLQAQQNLMSLTDLTPYNAVFIMVGTNDIQNNGSVTSFGSLLASMLSEAKMNNRMVIIGIPPMFIGKDETNYGMTTLNPEKGGHIRNMIYYMANANGVLVADVMMAMGKIDKDNKQLRDNIHMRSWAQPIIAQTFASALTGYINNDISYRSYVSKINANDLAIKEIKPTLLNGWLENDASTPVRILKTGKTVEIQGVIKGGAVGNLFNVPAGYRPKNWLYFPIYKSAGFDSLVLDSSGNLKTGSGFALNSSFYSIHFTYIAEQ